MPLILRIYCFVIFPMVQQILYYNGNHKNINIILSLEELLFTKYCRTSGKTMEFVTHDKRQQEQTCRVSCWMIRLGEMFWKCCLDISYTGSDIQ